MTTVYSTNSGKVIASAPLRIYGVNLLINGNAIEPTITPQDIYDRESFADNPQWLQLIDLSDTAEFGAEAAH